MQQTRLDHWLRRRFVHETRIYCNVLPGALGAGYSVEEAGEGRAGTHRYRITPLDDNALDQLVERLRYEGITYAAAIEDQPGDLAQWLNRPGRSVTYEIVWWLIAICSGGALLYFLPFAKIVSFVNTAWPF